MFVSNKSLDAKLVTLQQEHSSNDGEIREPAARATADGEVIAVLAAGTGAVVHPGRVLLHRQEDRGPVRQVLSCGGSTPSRVPEVGGGPGGEPAHRDPL